MSAASKPSPAPRKIPVCVPLLDGHEERYVAQAVRDGWISSVGPAVAAFEKGFASWCGAAHGVGVSNGTAALHLALRALDVGPGDEVVIPDFAMVAVLFAVLYCGATPVAVDVEPDTGNLDPARVAEAVGPRTKAVIAVHTYGHPCDVEALRAATAGSGAAIVEDAAEAHGAEWRGRRAGALGDVASFSFYANKILTTGEGGMVVTSNERLAERCRYLRNLCFPLDAPRDYFHEEIGFNYRLTNVQAALGLAQLERADALVERRRATARRYAARLAAVPGVRLPIERAGARNVHWMFAIRVDPERFGATRDELARELAGRGVETRPFFRPMHVQPPYLRARPDERRSFLVSDRLAAEGLYLPSSPALTDDDVAYVCEAIATIGRRG
ncbi:MAG: DegT/DnrJ/EryC1/StrS family aminotransferase [Deltaproteobacteria bacterium]|nr:DegT/DnrJ/EryC1/StrS family aminotransferase [Deltaproteobacteria bacterium]